MNRDDLKRLLRRLKKKEIASRFPNVVPKADMLVWSKYFSIKGKKKGIIYPFNTLSEMNRNQIKNAVDDYETAFYYQLFMQYGMTESGSINPELLIKLGLNSNADMAEVKKRFRKLASETHPDHGGDVDDFIRIRGIYEEIVKG